MEFEFEHKIEIYSLEELRDLRGLIDREEYPEEYAAVLARIAMVASQRQSIAPSESVQHGDNTYSSPGYFAFRCPNCRARTVSIWTKLDLQFPSLQVFFNRRITTVCAKCGKSIGLSRWADLFQGVVLILAVMAAVYLFAGLEHFIGWLIWLVTVLILAAYLVPVLLFPLIVIDGHKENP